MTLRTISVAPARSRDGRPDAGFGVEQEVGRDDHAFACHQAAPYAVPTREALADRDFTRLVVALPLVQEHERAFPGLDDRALRYHEHGRGGALEIHVREHVRLEQAIRVAQLDARFDRACLGLHRGRHEVDHAPPLTAGWVGQDNSRGETHSDRGEVLLVQLGQDPRAREVRDLVETVRGRDLHPLEGGLLHHQAGDGRAQADRPARRPCPFERGDLLRADIQRAQTLAGSVGQLRPALGHTGNAGFTQSLLSAAGHQVLLLGGDQLRAIDRQQWLAPVHRLAGEVYIQLLDVALVLGLDDLPPPLVNGHAADGAQSAAADAGRHRLAPDTEQLRTLWSDRHRRASRHGGGALRLLRVDRDVVHAHVVLRRLVGADGRVHWV